MPSYEERKYSEVRTTIPAKTVTKYPSSKTTLSKPRITSGRSSARRVSGSGSGSGRSSNGSSPIQKIPEVKKEEPKPKPIPIPKLLSSQKERRERDLMSKGLRTKGRIQGSIKRQIIYSPKSEIEYEKRLYQERFKEKKKQIFQKQIKKKQIKEEQIKKEYNDKELKKRLKAYQIYLQTLKQKKQKPIEEFSSSLKPSEEIQIKKTKIKWW